MRANAALLDARRRAVGRRDLRLYMRSHLVYLPVSLTVASNYSSRAIREHLRKRGIRAVIPIPADQRGHRLRRGSRDGRPPAFDRETYTQRNAVERCINRLKQWRGIATRYEKTATVYLAGLHVAGIFPWSAD